MKIHSASFIISAIALFCICGCSGITPEPAVDYVSRVLYFDDVRPASVRLEKVKLPDQDRNVPWYAFLPCILYGTWCEDASESSNKTYDPTFRTPSTENLPSLKGNRDKVSLAFSQNLAHCLRRAGIFETVETEKPAGARLRIEFTVFRRNSRLYTYGLTPLVAAASFWLIGCPFRGVWYEFEADAKLVTAGGEEIWKGKIKSRSTVIHGTCWSGKRPECTAFFEAYTLFLTDLFKQLAKNLPPADDKVWKDLPHKPEKPLPGMMRKK
ncbi:MAG: hypothetical protein E3J72_09020 [Planctomycetota bacterium]|nr:MAG: hypothetical protein E3J72_09020 [Planctomycetota bacterium]